MKERDNRRPTAGIDSLLEAAIKHYSGAEPRPGLEQRLLVRLRETPAPSPLLRWHYLVPAALVLCLGAVALYVALRPPSMTLSPDGQDIAHLSPDVPKMPADSPSEIGQVPEGDSGTTVAAGPPPPQPGGPGTSREPLRADVRGPLAPMFPSENQEDLLFAFLEASGTMPDLQELNRQRSFPSHEIAELSIPPLSIEFLPGFNPEDFEKGE